MGGSPKGIDPNDQDGLYVQTWRRTYDEKALGGMGSWNNELVSFRKKGDDISENLVFDMLELGHTLENIKDALKQVFPHLDAMQREISISNGIDLQKEIEDAADDKLDEMERS
jgi:hypothetical protein